MPPKRKRSQSSTSRFLFVNEDAATISSGERNSQTGRTKQSHVQRQIFARRQRQLQEQPPLSGPGTEDQTSEASSSAIAGRSGSNSRAVSVPTSEDPFPNTSQDSLFLLETHDALHISPDLEPEGLLNMEWLHTFSAFPPSDSHLQPQLFENSHQNETGVFPSISPHSDLNHFRPPINRSLSIHSTTDVFQDPKMMLGLWAPPLIQHHNLIVIPEKFYVDVRAVSLTNIRVVPSIHEFMQACMTEPVHLYTFLAAAAAQMVDREGKLALPGIEEKDDSRVIAYFETKATEALQQHLALPTPSHHTANDVLNLVTSHVFLGNYREADARFNDLIAATSRLGGLQNFSDYFVENLVVIDWLWALRTLEEPRTPSTWNPGRLPHYIFEQVEADKNTHPTTGQRLKQIFLHNNCTDSVLSEVVDDLIEATRFSIYLTHQNYYDPNQYRWLSLRKAAIAYSVFHLSRNNIRSSMYESQRLTLLLWISLSKMPSLTIRSSNAALQALRTNLEATLLEINDRPFEPNTEFILWASVVAYTASGPHNQNRTWYKDTARNAVGKLAIQTFQDLETCLAGFFYEPDSQRQSVQAMVAELDLGL